MMQISERVNTMMNQTMEVKMWVIFLLLLTIQLSNNSDKEFFKIQHSSMSLCNNFNNHILHFLQKFRQTLCNLCNQLLGVVSQQAELGWQCLECPSNSLQTKFLFHPKKWRQFKDFKVQDFHKFKHYKLYVHVMEMKNLLQTFCLNKLLMMTCMLLMKLLLNQ